MARILVDEEEFSVGKADNGHIKGPNEYNVAFRGNPVWFRVAYRDIIESWGFAREKGTEYSLSTLFSDPMTSEKIPKWFPIERLMKIRINRNSNIDQHKTICDDTMIV